MKNHVKTFSKFINERHFFFPSYHEEGGSGREEGGSVSALEAVVYDALGGNPRQIQYLGSVADGSAFEHPVMDELIDLFDQRLIDEEGIYELVRPGRIVYKKSTAGPGGFVEVHYFKHRGIKCVVVVSDDGPYIYVNRS